MIDSRIAPMISNKVFSGGFMEGRWTLCLKTSGKRNIAMLRPPKTSLPTVDGRLVDVYVCSDGVGSLVSFKQFFGLVLWVKPNLVIYHGVLPHELLDRADIEVSRSHKNSWRIKRR